MTCDDVRLALSARLDGEDPRTPAAALDTHLITCLGCRAWLARAERLNRVVRVQVAAVPDLTARVLAAVADDPRRPAPARNRPGVVLSGHRQILRVAVAVTAVAQLLVALPALLAGLGVSVDPHTSREMASFDIALAVGFVLAAYRPERAHAFVPVAFVLAVCLAGTSLIDIVNSTTALVHEIGHLAAVVQAGLLWALGRVDRRISPPLTTKTALGG